jgi:hypothetical protein
VIDRLVAVLAKFSKGAGDLLDAGEVLDLLWLMRTPPQERQLCWYPVGDTQLPETEGQRTAHPAPGGDDLRETEEIDSDQQQGPVTDLLDDPVRSRSRAGRGGEKVYPRVGLEDSGHPSRPVREVSFRSGMPLPHRLELGRSLRRLRQVTRPGPARVDEEASVRATAEATHVDGPDTPWVFVPVMHQPPVRALDLVLVIDSEPSVRIWNRAFDDLRQMCWQTGAFRSVASWRLHLDGDGGQDVWLTPTDKSKSKQPPGRLIDPSGSRVVLVVTDGVGPGWFVRRAEPSAEKKGIWAALAHWASAMPTAIIQILPPDYWPETGMGRQRGWARSPFAAAPNRSYLTQPPWSRDQCDIPVPVLSLDEEALADWAEAMVSGTSPVPIVGTVHPPVDTLPAETNAYLDMEEIVRSFRNRASPEARKLARILSYPQRLTLPLIEVLRDGLVPKAGISEQAEIFVSGMVRRSRTSHQTETSYEFDDTAKKLLQMGATSFERWDIYELASTYVQRWRGTNGDLTGLMSDPSGPERLDPTVESFAELATYMADRISESTSPLIPIPALGSAALTVVVESPIPSEPAAVAEDFVPSEELEQVTRGEMARRPGAELVVPSDIDVVRGTFARAIAAMNGQPLSVVDLGARAIRTHQMRRDPAGTPRRRASRPVSWADLAEDGRLRQSRLIQAANLRWGATDLLVCSAPEEDMAVQALEMLRSARPEAGWVVSHEIPVPELIDDAIDREPIQKRYVLKALVVAGNGALEISEVPLFDVGQAQGATRELRIHCEPSHQHGMVLAVCAVDERTGQKLMSMRSGWWPQGRVELLASLDGPSRVNFADRDGPLRLVNDPRIWAEIAKTVPRYYVPKPHLICAVETSGSPDDVRRRLHNTRQVIERLEQHMADWLQVSLLAYGPHSFDRSRGYHDKVQVAAQGARADEAQAALEQIERSGINPVGYPYAAMIEDVLALVNERIAPTTRAVPGRTALLIVGHRPPHPPRADLSGILPCQRQEGRLAWDRQLDILAQRRHTTICAICDLPPERANPVWRRLGRDMLLYREDMDAARVVARTKLTSSSETLDVQAGYPLPLVIK